MNAGLNVFNDGNVIQIDGTFSNHQLVQKGTLTPSSQYFTWGVWAFNAVSAIQPMAVISFTAVEPLIAFNSNAMAALMSTQRNGDTWTLHFWMPDGGSLEWFIFDKARISTGSYGMQVFNENAELVFDATNKYVRVVDYISGNIPYQNYGPDSFTSTFSYGQGRKLAVAAVLTPGGYSGIGSVSYNNPNEFKVFVAYGGWSISGGNIYMSWRQSLMRRGNQSGRDPYLASAYNASMSQYGALILDVTGY